jgi:hypothetical protein
MNTFVDYILVSKIKRPSIYLLSMPVKAIYSISFGKKSTSARTLPSTSSSRYALVSTICISKGLFIEILSPRIFLLKKAISLRYVISDGAFSLITVSSEILSVELSSTWLLR